MAKHGIKTDSRVIQFIDIHNYSIAVNVMEGNWSAFLQEVYERLGDIIVEYKGEIIKYMGDAILSVFPADSENEVIKCSLKLRKAFSDIVTIRDLPPETELEIGISSGEVEIGVFGHKSLRQKDVFGGVVNHAAVIGHHRGIAITEQVYNKIKMNYKIRSLAEFKVKWQNAPLKVWEVIE